MRKRILLHTLIIALASVLTGCENPYDKVSQEQESYQDFTVFITPYTRAQLNQDDYSVAWKQGDEIAVFDGAEWSQLKAIESGSPARFSGDIVPDGECIAAYPSDRKPEVADGKIFVDVPSEQAVSSATPSPATDLRLGLSRGRLIMMNAPLGYLTLSVNVDNITAITLEGCKGEMLSGKMQADLTYEGVTLSETLESYPQIRLTPAEGDTFKAGTYCCEIAPVALSEGLVLTFQREGCSKAQRTLPNPVNIKPSSVTDLGMWDLSAPEIESVTTLSATVSGDKALLSGRMSVVNFDPAKVTCGFEYKTASAEEWTSVTCDQASQEFSYQLTMESIEAHQFRAWAMVNGSDRIIYGEVGEEFAPKTLVLHLVFNGQEGRDLLMTKWGWKTNGNNSSTKRGMDMNNRTYYYTYEGVDYPFTFWALQSGKNADGEEATSGGYCFRHTTNVPNEALCLSNLGKDYAKDGHPAWMQFPCPDNARLFEVNAELKNTFSGHICSAVNEDGTWAGKSLAEYNGKKSFPIVFTDTEVGMRYYFTTEHLDLPRILSLTLTYMYTE